MGAYDRPGVVAERPAHDDARMHGGAVESAVGDLLERDDLVAIGQIEAGEDLVAVAAQARLDVAAGMGR